MINCLAPERRKCAEISCMGDCADAEWLSTPASRSVVTSRGTEGRVVRLPGSNNLVHRQHNVSNRVSSMHARSSSNEGPAVSRSFKVTALRPDANAWRPLSLVICHIRQPPLTAFTSGRPQYKRCYVWMAISQNKYWSEGGRWHPSISIRYAKRW